MVLFPFGSLFFNLKRSDSAEPTLHINQILSADFSAVPCLGELGVGALGVKKTDGLLCGGADRIYLKKYQ